MPDHNTYAWTATRFNAAQSLIGIALLIGSAACGKTDPTRWTIDVQRVVSPAGPNSTEPQLSVSDRGVLLSWMERAGENTTLKFAEWSPSGWTQPVTAASGADWFVSYADVPSVMRKNDGTLVAQWQKATNKLAEGYDLMLSYSTDNGKNWAAPFKPHHDDTQFQHGFATFLQLPGNGLGVAWLDGRNSEFMDNDPTSGTMTLRYAQFDSGWKQVVDQEIDHNVCECCQMSIAPVTGGALLAFRDRSDKDIRDVAVSRLQDGKWTTPTIVHNDNWEIYGCPVNGAALDARGDRAAVAWFTAPNDQGKAFAAFSQDAGRTWGAPIRLDDGTSLGRVDVEMLDDGTAVATWVEATKGSGEFRARLIDASGARSAPVTIANVGAGRGSGFPHIARRGDQLVFAWSASAEAGDGDKSGSRVYAAVAELP